jgi:hypothetical protein
MIGLGADIPRHTCSRAGCSATASSRVEWRNPRIHGPDRTKIWLACDEHVDYLHDFLAARDFPVTVVPLTSEVGS